ncbi:hypothetical protein ACH3WN_15655 [Streptomyces albogriseolus]
MAYVVTRAAGLYFPLVEAVNGPHFAAAAHPLSRLTRPVPHRALR